MLSAMLSTGKRAVVEACEVPRSSKADKVSSMETGCLPWRLGGSHPS